MAHHIQINHGKNGLLINQVKKYGWKRKVFGMLSKNMKKEGNKIKLEQCECNKPYPDPGHGDICLNCGKEIWDKAMGKLFPLERFGINEQHELKGGLTEPSY